MDASIFAPYGLARRGIDFAFVPYWCFDAPQGRPIVDEHLRPARLVACHIPPGELEAVARALARSDPDVLVPRAPLERFLVGHER